MKIHCRHCERSEAIQKKELQSYNLRVANDKHLILDCFTVRTSQFAMT